MFTGIIKEVGVLRSRTPMGESAELSVGCERILEGLAMGDSVAVNGVCLTVTRPEKEGFSADLSAETLARTTLGNLSTGAPLNLELPLRMGDVFGGHLVQGHVDELGKVAKFVSAGQGKELTIRVGEGTMRYIVPKGSIAVDGVSLTVVDIEGDTFRVALIPVTLEQTSLGRLELGDSVNLEVDIFAKYVERMVRPFVRESGIDEEFLRRTGFIEG